MVKYRTLEKKDILKIRSIALKSWRFAYKDIFKDSTIKRQVSKYYSDENFNNFFIGIKKGIGKFILAILNKEIVAYAHVEKKNNMWEVPRIYMNPKYTRKGIGSGLIKEVENFLRLKKAKRYILYPHPKNIIAINFYEKNGFKRNPKLDRKDWFSYCFEKKI